MDDKNFPIPQRYSRETKDAHLALRCHGDLKRKLWELIPDRNARATWLGEVLEFAVRKLEESKSQKPA